MKVAISYLRFSNAIQVKGDSFRRQNDSRDKWLEQNPDVKLETELQDFGLSAFKGHHRSRGDLGDFLEFIKTEKFQNRVARDEIFLLVESLDRLSRERIMTAVAQLEEIVRSGVKVVTLSDGQLYDRESLNDLGKLVVAVVIMSRAHEESARKSTRLKEAFKKMRADRKTCGAWLPGWLYKDDQGKIQVDKEKAKPIREIIQRIAKGDTFMSITRDFYNRGIKSPRGKETWSSHYLRMCIDRPSAIGTWLTKDGEIEDFYPPIIDRETFAKARQVLKNCKSWKGGNASKGHINILRKIAVDQMFGGSVVFRTSGRRSNSDKYKYSYMPSKSVSAYFKGAQWSARQVEAMILIPMNHALAIDKDNTGDELKLARLEEEIEKIERKIKNLVELLEDDPDPDLKSKLEERRLERDGKIKELNDTQERILSGGKKVFLNPEKASREEIAQALRSNVKEKGIVLDFKERKISVSLVNGIEYQVKINGNREIIVQTNCFDIPERISLVGSNGRERIMAPLVA